MPAKLDDVQHEIFFYGADGTAVGSLAHSEDGKTVTFTAVEEFTLVDQGVFSTTDPKQVAAGLRRLANALEGRPGNTEFPEELPDSLVTLFGRPLEAWHLFAQEYRNAGHYIPEQKVFPHDPNVYSYVQAFFLHRMVWHWMNNGGNWLHAADAELKGIRALNGAVTGRKVTDEADFLRMLKDGDSSTQETQKDH